MPYLFGTTYGASQIMRGKTIHIPCLHDEPLAYLPIFRDHRVIDIAFHGDQPFLVGTDPRVRRRRSVEDIQDLLRRYPVSFYSGI